MLTKAGQPEILRAYQRDQSIQKELNDKASDLLLLGLGVRTWLRYREVWKGSVSFIYQTLTTLSGLQTLGEEYTGIVQVNQDKTKLPSKYAQIVMILLDICGERVLVELLDKTEKYFVKLPTDHPLKPEARETLIRVCQVLQNSVPYIQRVHKGVFYLNGNTYQVSKRVSGIHYALVRFWLKDRTSLPTFRLLGWISFIQLGLHLLLGLYQAKKQQQHITLNPDKTPSTLDRVDYHHKCSLCLNTCGGTSVTPCGHLFCWSCIIPWLQERQQCPLCRQQVNPSRVVPLRNFPGSNIPNLV